MKKAIVAVLALASASLAFAHGATATVTPSVAANSSTAASAYAGTGGGFSLSGAYNEQSAATNGVGAGAAGQLGPVRSASVGVSGQAATQGLSAAGNFSAGNANGSAQAVGASTASVIGAGNGHTVTNGPTVSVTGNAEAVTQTGATSGTNGLGVSGGAAVGHFDSAASATQLSLGPIRTADVNSHALAGAVTTPSIQIQVGSSTVSIQNEAAANAFGQARVGAQSSQSSN